MVNAYRAFLLMAAISASVQGFVHPGILVNRQQLDFVKAKIGGGEEPWSAAFAKARSSRYGNLNYAPSPMEFVGCGSSDSPNEGCTAERDDAIAAYTHALLWSYTGQRVHANGLLQAAWAGEVFTRSAENIRHTNAGWTDADIQRFSDMLNTAFLPRVINGWTGGGGNWLLSMAEATMNIGIFTENQATFENGLCLVYRMTWEIGYNHYSTREGMALPETEKLIAAQVGHLTFETGCRDKCPVHIADLRGKTLFLGESDQAGILTVPSTALSEGVYQVRPGIGSRKKIRKMVIAHY